MLAATSHPLSDGGSLWAHSAGIAPRIATTRDSLADFHRQIHRDNDKAVSGVQSRSSVVTDIEIDCGIWFVGIDLVRKQHA